MLEEIDLDHLSYNGILGAKGKKLSFFFFILGLAGAFAIRLVLILTHYSQFWATLVWYLAMISYVLFYYHRFHVEMERRRMVLKNNLIGRFQKEELSKEDKNKILIILNSVAFSRARFNLLIILLVTILMLIVEIVIDLLK